MLVRNKMSQTIEVEGEALELFPQRGIWWETRGVLLMADLHLGKVNHFRRSGIPVPSKANDKNIAELVHLITGTNPSRVIMLGDLFHSHYNSEWEVFGELTRHFNHVQFELVLGNHDIMSDVQYERKGITIYNTLAIGPFLLTHHPEMETTSLYNLAGHVHPGVKLTGKGKQTLTFPCFYFGQRQGFLPAFGAFTGTSAVRPTVNDRIFAIVEGCVVPVGEHMDRD